MGGRNHAQHGTTFEHAGAELLEPACGACANCGTGSSADAGEVTISAINRNFPGRSGPGKVWLASPPTVPPAPLPGNCSPSRNCKAALPALEATLDDMLSTADLCDRFLDASDGLQVVAPGLRSFGGRAAYMGQIATMPPAREGASLRLRDALCQPGHGRVLVVDAHASDSWALLGDQLAALGLANGWAGVVLNGYVRDVRALAGIATGVHALGAMPMRPR